MPDQRLIEDFTTRFGSAPTVYQAPGRVNLIGEHTDYNDGFVMPAAIGFHTLVAIGPRPDRLLVVHSENYSEHREFNLDQLPKHGSGHWSDYVAGVAKVLAGAGFKVRGANLLIRGNVPLGAGLSSSASIEVAVCYALLNLASEPTDRTRIALLCQQAENQYV